MNVWVETWYAVADMNTRKVAVAALMAALAATLLSIAGIIPTGSLGFSALAGLATAAALIECGWVPAILQFVSASVLGILIAANKDAAIVYVLFFGWYPLVKSLLERIRSRALCYVLKGIVFAIAELCALALVKAGFISVEISEAVIWLLMLAGLAVFFIYDFCLSRLIDIYIRRIRGRTDTK